MIKIINVVFVTQEMVLFIPHNVVTSMRMFPVHFLPGGKSMFSINRIKKRLSKLETVKCHLQKIKKGGSLSQISKNKLIAFDILLFVYLFQYFFHKII